MTPLRYRRKLERQRHFIEPAQFPQGLSSKLQRRYPNLSEAQIAQVLSGLRGWFLICAAAKGRFVAMPSSLVDHAWHEFILFTRSYENYCKLAFGTFLHDTGGRARGRRDGAHCRRAKVDVAPCLWA